MNVSLTPEFEAFVGEKVKSGTYTTASEVVRAGLRLLQAHDAEQMARLEALRTDVRAGVAQVKRGEGEAGDTVFQRVRHKNRVRRAG